MIQIIRKLSRNWRWVLINILGLSLAYSCIALVLSFTSKELSYDRFNTKADRIYRATTSTDGSSVMHPARVWGKWVSELPKEYAGIEDFVRLVPFKKGVVEIENQRFFSDHLFKADSSFFQVFDFKLIQGEAGKVLSKPRETVITEALALKYFGNTEVLGKQISITHQQSDSAFNYTVVGVMQDFPENSHFHADALTSLSVNQEVNQSWGYTYYLMKQDTDVETLTNNIQQHWDEELKEGQLRRVLHFQKLTDIHLYSHKTREMETNGDVRSLVLLGSGAFIILFIALINFLNLTRVQFISDLKAIKIKMINGAEKKGIAKEMLGSSAILSLLVLGIGLILSNRLGPYLGVNLFTSPLYLILLSILFSLSICGLSILPLYTSKVSADSKVAPPKSEMYAFPLVIQFTLAVITITGTIVLDKQMNFLNEVHPQANNENIIVIERNPITVVHRYDRFKEELLNNASITNMTGAMEEPGGDVLDNFRFEMEGIESDHTQTLFILTADPSFLKSLDVKPLAGSIDLGYTPDQKWEQDAIELSLLEQSHAGTPRVEELRDKVEAYKEKYILNESALKMLGIETPEDAIGRSFRLIFHLPYVFPEGEIVAVVPDFHYTNMHSQERPLVMAPRRMFNYNFLIQIDPKRQQEALAALKTTWEKINPEYPLEYGFIQDSYNKVYQTERSQTKVLSLFALISIVLSCLGIYAISAFSMQRRVKEIGIRKVNGASIGEIMLMLNKKFMIWVLLSYVLALPIAWYAMNRWLETFAYKIDLSWWIFALAGLTSIIIALLTISIQSYKTASKNPVDSLRYE